MKVIAILSKENFILLLTTFMFGFMCNSQHAHAQTRDSIVPTTHEILVEDLLKNEQQNNDFEDIAVITTSRTTEQKSSKAAATIYIVTAEQIQRRGYMSLSELLADVPNIRVDNLVDPRWNNNVIIRGVTGANANANDKFVLLIDGVRANSPTNDIIPIMENYPVHFAKQVEIVFGPSSALYGADAFAGVINIITKSADDLKKNEIGGIGGSYNYYLGNLILGKKINDKLSYTFSAQYMNDQQPQLSKFYQKEYEKMESNLATGEFNTIFGPIPANVNPIYSQTPLSAYALHANVKYSDFSFSFFRNKSVNPATIAQTPNNVVNNAGSFFGHSVTMGNITYNKTFGKVQLNSFLVGSQYNLDPESNFRNVYTNLRPAYKFSVGRMLKLEQLATYTPNSTFSFTIGGTYENFFSNPRGQDLEFPIYDRSQRPVITGSIYPNNPKGIDGDIVELTFSNTGGLFQAQITPIEKLAITLGGRYDYNSRYGGSFNPRAGIVYEINKNFTAKFLYGSAFLAPSPLAAFEQFGSFSSRDNGTTYSAGFFRLPNPNLKPQTIQTFESTISFNSKKIRLNLNGFYSLSEGLFAYGPDAINGNAYNGQFRGWPIGFIQVAINQGKQTNYGGAFQVNYRESWGKNNKIEPSVSVSYVQGNVSTTSAGVESKTELPAISPWIFKTGVDVDVDKFSFSVRAIFIEQQFSYLESITDKEKRQRLKGYMLLNLQANYRLNNFCTLFVQAKNLLDQRYYSVNAEASPEGRVQSSAEFDNGAPQNPIRIMGGFNVKF